LKKNFFFLSFIFTNHGRSDDRRAWDEGAYLILARLDLVDVSVQRESDDVFLLRVDGVGDQRFQMRDKQHMSSFLDKLYSARDLRKGSVTPRSDTEQSPSPSPLLFRRDMWPRGTLTGQAIEEELSDEFDLRINNQADLVDMVRRAYASDGFLRFLFFWFLFCVCSFADWLCESNPRGFVAVKTDNNATSLALETLRSVLRGTPLESPDLARAATLDEAKKALARVAGLSEEQRAVLATYNNGASRQQPRGVDKSELEKAERSRAEQEALAKRLTEETSRLEEQLSKTERDNALLDMKLSDASQRGAEAERKLARALATVEDQEAQLEKERSKQTVLKEMLSEQQQQQERDVAIEKSVPKRLAEPQTRSSKLVIESRSPQALESNSSMADFSIAEEDLDSILGEFGMASPTDVVSPGSVGAADRTITNTSTTAE
jgi:hypothetical protein